MLTGATLLAIFKAIPALEKIFSEAVDLYIKQANASDENNMNKIQAQRDALVASISRSTSHEERDHLRRLLYSLHRH